MRMFSGSNNIKSSLSLPLSRFDLIFLLSVVVCSSSFSTSRRHFIFSSPGQCRAACTASGFITPVLSTNL